MSDTRTPIDHMTEDRMREELREIAAMPSSVITARDADRSQNLKVAIRAIELARNLTGFES